MKIIITGGAGFIGSQTAKKLLQLGHSVSILDNLDPYYPVKLKRHNLDELRTAGLTPADFHQLDIRDTGLLSTTFQTIKPEVVIHLAAKAGVRSSIEDPESYFSTNVDGTLNVLQAARKVGVRKVLVASSSSVYGINATVPFCETDPVESQISPYAASKRALEVLCKMYAEVYALPIQAFRFFTVYGPSGRPDMAPAIFTKAILNDQPLTIYGGTDSQRDYTYIDDIVSGLVHALEVDDRFEIYNLGNDQPQPLSELITAVEIATGKTAKLNIVEKQVGDVDKTWADVSKARTKLKYQPTTSLHAGIQKFVRWYLKHGELYT